MKLKTKQSNKAFIMLFAVVFSSIVLAIGLGVAGIALKELSFSTSAKGANDAFYAADTGAECALFHDLAWEVSAFGLDDQTLNTYSIITTCGGSDVDLYQGTTAGPWTFTIYGLGSAGKACAKVTVTKLDVSGVITTTVSSKGYNLGGDTQACTSTSANRVERELELTY